MGSVVVSPVFAFGNIQGFREPDLVAGGFVPSIACGCEVAEVDLAWLAVAFQICSGYHGAVKDIHAKSLPSAGIRATLPSSEDWITTHSSTKPSLKRESLASTIGPRTTA